jgi:D-arabinose 1-dehydrogenase-like Zn-dependent alcohol dehydrogenase
MCGGATVWGALKQYNVTATDRVGILGIGGLGHMAIQFASKMGCDVVVFSGTESKREEAMGFGASEFHATKDNPELKGIKPIDRLVITTSQQPDFDL